MKKYILIAILGLFLLAYLLEAVVDPLSSSKVGLNTPYSYFTLNILSRFPFTTAIVLIRSLGIFLTPLLLASFIDKNQLAKGGSLLVLAALMQLYAVQDVVTNANVIPLEWSISLAGGGAALLVPAFIFLVQGILLAIHYSLVGKVRQNIQKTSNANAPTWLDSDSSPKK